jgi:hypothetical protein
MYLFGALPMASFFGADVAAAALLFLHKNAASFFLFALCFPLLVIWPFPALYLQAKTISPSDIDSPFFPLLFSVQSIFNPFSLCFPPQTFRRLLVKKCQEEFVRRSNIFDEIDQLKAQGIQVCTDT